MDGVGINNYTIGIKEIDDRIGGIKKGSNILLIGPPMSGKESISNHIIQTNVSKNENAVMVLTTCEPAIQILEKFKMIEHDLLLSRVAVVDCISKKYGVTEVKNENIKFVNGPEDLTAIGVKIGQLFEEFYMKKKIQNIQLHINSLSTLLMYSNIQTVFRFLHVFTSRIKMAGALGIYLIDSSMHDEHIIASIKQLCDGMIEIKLENDRKFIRTTGIFPATTPWLEYYIEGDNVIISKEGGTIGSNNMQMNSISALVNDNR